jgi:hypothetical protein
MLLVAGMLFIVLREEIDWPLVAALAYILCSDILLGKRDDDTIC